MKYIEEFFATARARYEIMLKKQRGDPWPWTDDPSMRDWHLCNVHREDDRTTKWLREEITTHLRGMKAVRATLIFRWFNRIETCEIIKGMLLDTDTWNSDVARKRLANVSPIVTGAYIILGQQGYPKLEGVLRAIDDALGMIDDMLAPHIHGEPTERSLEGAWGALICIPYLGPFMAYELVSDLRWTDTLDRACDIMTWANPGPGCMRGMGRVYNGQLDHFQKGAKGKAIMLDHMRDLLHASQDEHYWPKEWRHWELREVEHTLCEFDKIQRAREGSRLKRSYHPR